MIFPPSRPDPVDAVWCTWRGEPELLEARERYYTADQMDAHATAAYAEGRADERAEWLPVLEVLRRIVELDPEVDSTAGYNEWGEADCFRLAQDAARTAIARVTEG